MSLADIVSVTITAQTTTVSRAGFGTPLIAGFHANFPQRSKEYSGLAGLITDGFTVNDPIYRCATKVMGQSPRPQTFKVGRRALAPTQVVVITPTDTTLGVVTSLTIISPDGTSTAITRTNGGAETVATISAALLTLIDAIVGVTATGGVTEVTCTADAAGDLFDYQALTGGLDLQDTTADPGIATDLAAIRLEDGDWYGLALDSNSEAEIAASATWAETETVLFGANTADTGVKDSLVTTDVGSDLQLAAVARTFLLWSGSVLSYAAAAWLGKMLPTDPGTNTWAFKTLALVTVDSLNTDEVSALNGKGVNHYTRIAGVNITRPGNTSAGEFIDVTRYIDFLTARLQENIFALLVNLPKLPYTDSSVDLVRGEILAQLQRGVAAGALAGTPEPTVTAPAVADIASTDRAARLLPDVEFTAQLAGAIHQVTLTGTLTV